MPAFGAGVIRKLRRTRTNLYQAKRRYSVALRLSHFSLKPFVSLINLGAGDRLREQDEAGEEEEPEVDNPNANLVQKTSAGPGVRKYTDHEISTPVGTNEGQVIFAQVRFGAPLRKEYVTT